MSAEDILANSAMIKIRKEVQQRRLRLEPFFHDFDKLKSGRVTKDQFARVLSTTRVLSLSPDELAAVSAHFDIHNNNNNTNNSTNGKNNSINNKNNNNSRGLAAGSVFNYTKFLQELHQIKTNLAATTSRNFSPPAPSATVSFQDPNELNNNNVNKKELSEKEKSLMDSAMAVFRRQVKIQNLSLLPPFYDFDPLRSGRVTRSQFARCLPFKMIDGRVLNILMDYYGDESGENVCYLAWCQAVDETLQPASAILNNNNTTMMNTTPMTTTTTTTTVSSPAFFSGTTRNKDLTAEQLIQLLRAQCAQYKLRCEDYFADADKFHTGLVNAAQFESVLGRLQLVGFALSSENVDALVQCYALDDHLRSTNNNNNNNKTNSINQKMKNTNLYNSLTQANKHLARVNYKSFLYDINPKNFPQQDQQTSADGNNTVNGRRSSVNYFATRHLPDAFLDSVKKNNNNNNNNKTEKESADAILNHIRHLVVANRIYLSPIFRDFDRVTKSIKEHRTCTATRFARGLATQNLILPQKELELLTRKYTTPRADGSPSEEVNYYQFVRDVDPSQAPLPSSSSNVKGTAAGAGVSAVQRLQQTSDKTSSSSWRPATTLDALLEKMVREAHLRHLRLSAFFLDFDLLRSGQVQKEKFITALTLSGLQLQAEEMELLKSSFASKRVPDYVDLIAFMRELNSYTVDDNADTAFYHSQKSNSNKTKNGGSQNGKEGGTRSIKVVSTLKHSTGDAAAAAAAQLTTAEQETLQKVLARLRHDARTHNALLTPFFEDFDRYHQGNISQTNFQQALARHKFQLSDRERALLGRYYGVPTDPLRVDYRRFVADVGFEETAPPAPPATQHLLEETTNNSHHNHEQGGEDNMTDEEVAAVVDEVLEKMCCFLQERHASVDEFFPDGDELRHQHISRVRFRSGLSALGDAAALHLTEKEFHALEVSFASAQDISRISYPLFAQHVRAKLDAGDGLAAVTQRRAGSTRAPTTASIRALAASQPSAAAAAEAVGKTQEEKLFIATMLKIRRLLAARRTNALPAFREYDTARKGRVKESQFFSCLLSLGVRLTPQESAAVAAAYSLGNGEVGYVKFVQEVDASDFEGSS